jgi:hydroxymethylbilane synthase
MPSPQPIKIGTRNSELAMWQANTVASLLREKGYEVELFPVKSTGDLNLDQPLYEMGITGIFTKTLDIALLKGEIDIAVHSMKDVPTQLPKTVVKAAVLPRANPADILLHKGTDFLTSDTGSIATGSLRRKAQWLNKYPTHHVENLRGNVNTRLKKLSESDWDAAIFAAAGLERINLKPDEHISLDWMIPAPAQGAMLVVTTENNSFCREALAHLHHQETDDCVSIERDFLRTLEGGCTAPIGALAKKQGDVIQFEGALFSLDGKQKFSSKKQFSYPLKGNEGQLAAKELLDSGARKLMQQIKETLA